MAVWVPHWACHTMEMAPKGLDRPCWQRLRAVLLPLAKPTWESLPAALLGRALRVGAPSDQSARFATCTTFAKAMLLPDPDRTDPQLTVHVDDFRPALAKVLRWAGEGRFRLKLVCKPSGKVLQHASLQPWLDLLQQKGVLLTGVSEVWCKGLQLTTGDLSALAPNLQVLQLENCQVAEGMQPMSGCNQLRELVLDPEGFAAPGKPTTPAAWHLQLASLPSLASVTLNTCHHPTSFLPLLADQLTQLNLKGMFGEGNPWQAALQHTAQLTSLRSLHLGCCEAQDLITLTGLPQLQQLNVYYVPGGDDAAITALLQFPHLTNLTWLEQDYRPPQQSYTDQPCSWKELQLNDGTPQVLARLPLHSVTTLRLSSLTIVPCKQTTDNIIAAVNNINRGQQTQVVGSVAQDADSFRIKLDAAIGQQAGYSDLLLSIKALVPQDITAVTISHKIHGGQRGGGDWSVDAAVVTALQQALPPTITSIEMDHCRIEPSFWPQLATSFPRLEYLNVYCNNKCSSLEVMSYYHSASLAHRAAGVPQVADVEIEWDNIAADRDEQEQWVDSFTDLNLQLRLLGLKATVTAQYMYYVPEP